MKYSEIKCYKSDKVLCTIILLQEFCMYALFYIVAPYLKIENIVLGNLLVIYICISDTLTYAS